MRWRTGNYAPREAEPFEPKALDTDHVFYYSFEY
jgi:hypothetical protein